MAALRMTLIFSASLLIPALTLRADRIVLRNLDPDRLYPVYGDASEVGFAAQSQGKFYLAVDSDTISAVVGNYPMALTDTELARCFEVNRDRLGICVALLDEGEAEKFGDIQKK